MCREAISRWGAIFIIRRVDLLVGRLPSKALHNQDQLLRSNPYVAHGSPTQPVFLQNTMCRPKAWWGERGGYRQAVADSHAEMRSPGMKRAWQNLFFGETIVDVGYSWAYLASCMRWRLPCDAATAPTGFLEFVVANR